MHRVITCQLNPTERLTSWLIEDSQGVLKELSKSFPIVHSKYPRQLTLYTHFDIIYVAQIIIESFSKSFPKSQIHIAYELIITIPLEPLIL